jgi:predicted RNA-binding Zn-ribbon protein involved in translation (DUF1610 family)
MGKKEKDQREEEAFDNLGDLEEFLGLNEKEEYISFQCIDCGCIDPVPEFIIDEFSYDLKDGEEVEMHCPKCNGTMRRAKEKPGDE